MFQMLMILDYPFSHPFASQTFRYFPVSTVFFFSVGEGVAA